jgi:ligand-binding sensor domain-containing protein
MRKIALLYIVLLGSLASAAPATAQQIYNFYAPGDWVSFTQTRYITSIAAGFNIVYFATTDGILRYDRSQDEWLDPLTVSDGMPRNDVSKIAVDGLTDEIWIQTPSQAAYYNPTFQDWSYIAEFPMDKVQPPNISIHDLPQLFTPQGYSYFPQGFVTDRYAYEYDITQLLRDDRNRIWAGLWGLGPAEIDISRDDLKLMPQGLYEDDVAGLTVDGDEVWFLGGGSGIEGTITYYNQTTSEWSYYDPHRNSGIISDQYLTIAHDSNNVWIGTDLGLVRCDKKSHTFKSYSHFDGIYGQRVTALLPIENNLMIGTDEGISVFDIKRDTIYNANSELTAGLLVFDFAINGRTIYAATERGIYTLQWGGSSWKPLKLKDPLLHGYVYNIQVADSSLYAISDDGVVVVDLNDNSTKVWDLYTEFKNADLFVLLVHDGVIWVGGTSGLFRYNARTRTWYQYSENDGLISSHVTSLSPDGNFIWIGTDSGATRFYWANFNRNDWYK